MHEQEERINITEDITLVLRCDPSELNQCQNLKKYFRLIPANEIMNVFKQGIYQCYDQFYLSMNFSYYFDKDMNMYFMISPFKTLLRLPEDIMGLSSPIKLETEDGKVGTIRFVYKDGKHSVVMYSDDDYFGIHKIKLKAIFPDITEENSSPPYILDARSSLIRQMVFDPELSEKFFIKQKDVEISAVQWHINADLEKYKQNMEKNNISKQLVLELELLENKINMIETTYENVLGVINKLSEKEINTFAEKTERVIKKIDIKANAVLEKYKDNFFNVITEQLDEEHTKISNKPKTNIPITFTDETATDDDKFLRILHEKLVSYNQRNPQYLYDNGLLEITRNKLNEDKANTNKMKRLYELYKSGTYAHKYDWDQYFESYIRQYDHRYDIDHILLTNNKVGDDIVGGFLIISNNSRDMSHSTYYRNNTFKSTQGREFTQVFITDTYQYSKNSDIPISFSYYLLSHYSNPCKDNINLIENGWCATQETSKIYEYMLYGWKYYESTAITNILYYDCIQDSEFNVIPKPEHYTIILDSQHLIEGYNCLYAKTFESSLPTIQTEFVAIYNDLNTKYGKKTFHTHITNEIKRSKETSNYTCQYMTSLMKLANVVTKSLKLNIEQKDSYSNQEIINLLLLDNIHDQHLFIKLKNIMESERDELLIFINIGYDTYTCYIRNISSKKSIHIIQKGVQTINTHEHTKVLTSIKDIFSSIFNDNSFYDIMSNTDLFINLKSQMIKSIKNVFTNEENLLSSYVLLDIVSSTNPQDFLKNAKTNKLYEVVYSVIKTAIAIGTFLTRYYEINKQYNYNKKFRKVLETINGSIITKDDLIGIKPTFLTDTHKDKYESFVTNLIELIQTKFKYREEINDFLNIPSKQNMYMQLLTPNKDSSYEQILRIFKDSEFGVEFESCFGVTVNATETCELKTKLDNRYNDACNTFVSHFDKLSQKYMPTNEQKKKNLNFTHDGGNISSETYSTWRLHVDPTINCPILQTNAIEVVTPILQFTDSDNKASGKDAMWKVISRKLYRENFGKRYEYSDGLFFLTTIYNFLLNNTAEKQYTQNIKIKTHANESQGMHLHISNPNMMLETVDNNKFCGLGALKMVYFIRMFAYFEHVIRNFLNRPPALQSSWAKSIYYLREQYSYVAGTQIGINDKKYIENTTYDKLKLYIQDPTSNQLFIAEMFERYRDNLIVKQGSTYGGAFAIKIYNGRGKCHLTNSLKNLCCKGHLEIRLHHSTDDFAEVYNWVLFINLFVSKSIALVDQLYEAKTTNYDEIFENIMGQYKTFPLNHTNSDVMKDMFDDLFDNFIQNNTLKRFYKKRCKEVSIKDSPESPSITNLELHTPYIFTTDGEIKDQSILKSMMSFMPLDINSTTSKEDLIKSIKNIDVKEQENDYNLIN